MAATVVFDSVHDEIDVIIEDRHEIQHEFQAAIDTTCHVHHGEWRLEGVFCQARRPKFARWCIG